MGIAFEDFLLIVPLLLFVQCFGLANSYITIGDQEQLRE